jgi:hypothetical protein
LNQFSHLEDGSSMFFQPVGTLSHYTLQKPKTLSMPYQLPRKPQWFASSEQWMLKWDM